MVQKLDEVAPPDDAPKKRFRCRLTGKFTKWLASSRGSVVISTYTSGKLVLVSPGGNRPHVACRRFPRPMGMSIHKNRLALAVQQKLLIFESTDGAYQIAQQFATGKVDAHDVAFGRRGVYFANTRYNCVARQSDRRRFTICWRPAFLSEVVPRDCCHLNGLGMLGGKPAVVTAFCQSAQHKGWKEVDRFTHGVLLEVPTGRALAEGLCMPHSPRWRQGRWWLCNSGHGTVESVDPIDGSRTVVCTLPGFTRGLCFVKNHALVGLSKIRPQHILDVPLARARQSEVTAGVALVDLRTGRQIGGIEFLEGGNEVYDVAFLPGIQRPQIIVPAAEG